jgi:multisubunit Na+/H+ antiporter MnhG subunit
MAGKRKVTGSFLAIVGYMLSPLSWWNDAFVNLPLALAFAWLVSVFYRPAFAPAVIVGYWLTNVVGLVLLHKGAQQFLSETRSKYSRRELLQDVGVSLAYTVLIVALIKFGVLKPVQVYLGGR